MTEVVRKQKKKRGKKRTEECLSILRLEIRSASSVIISKLRVFWMDQYITEDYEPRVSDSQWKQFITQAMCLCDGHASGVRHCRMLGRGRRLAVNKGIK